MYMQVMCRSAGVQGARCMVHIAEIHVNDDTPCRQETETLLDVHGPRAAALDAHDAVHARRGVELRKQMELAAPVGRMVYGIWYA